MTEESPLLDEPEAPKSQFPWVVVVVAVVIFVALAAWIMHEKSGDQARDAAVAVLEKELDTDQAALQNQKDKVVQLSQQLGAMKAEIQSGQLKDRKKAVRDYNALAAQQRAERDKWIEMANQYNEKVARLRKLQ